MTRDDILPFLRRRPFQPFRLHLRDGRSFDICFHELAMAGTKYFHIGIPVPNMPDPFADHVETVQLSEIERIEHLTPARESASA